MRVILTLICQWFHCVCCHCFCDLRQFNINDSWRELIISPLYTLQKVYVM